LPEKEFKLAVLQPSYIPWLGYFEQISAVDTFIFFDDVQYTVRDWRNRNYIKATPDKLLLTVPVHGSQTILIKDVKIDSEQQWAKKHLKAIKYNYAKAPHLKEIIELLEPILNHNWTYLAELNIGIIQAINAYLDIKTKLLRSSQLNIAVEDKNDRLINICKGFGATHYYTGKAAKEYMDVDLFQKNNIKVIFQDYTHPIYSQQNGDFIPFLSIIDLLCNCGKASLQILKGRN